MTGCSCTFPPASRSRQPLRAIVDVTADGAAAYNRVLIVLERGAKATFVEEYRSHSPAYVNTVVELIVGDEAPSSST